MGTGAPGAPLALSAAVSGNTSALEDHVVPLRGGHALDLWPLCGLGQAEAASLARVRRAPEQSPLVYFRASPERPSRAARSKRNTP